MFSHDEQPDHSQSTVLLISRAGQHLSTIARKLRGTLGIHSKYLLGRFPILLPPDHLLPVYKRVHNRYDTFLPELVKHVPPGSTVVDVGANCGDTMAAMLSVNAEVLYVAIEPDDVFFGYLERNADIIRQIEPKASITLHKTLIGKRISRAVLLGAGGSKHAVEGISGDHNQISHSSITLDSMLSLPQMQNVSILKSDVDGFDYDVIDSAEKLTLEQRPIIFFEAQFGAADGQARYERAMLRLASAGYREWTVFDNFGEVLVRSSNLDTVFQLFDYILRQTSAGSTRTIYYYDVATATEKHRAALLHAVDAYTQVGSERIFTIG